MRWLLLATIYGNVVSVEVLAETSIQYGIEATCEARNMARAMKDY